MGCVRSVHTCPGKLCTFGQREKGGKRGVGRDRGLKKNKIDKFSKGFSLMLENSLPARIPILRSTDLFTHIIPTGNASAASRYNNITLRRSRR